jgi:hypothetical protein
VYLLGALALGVTGTPSAPAWAGRIENQERAARKACLTGDPKRGVDILADLFIDTDDPTYIYNQGRCFEQNSRYEEAITKFREYLRKAGSASAADKADAEKHIADCQAPRYRGITRPARPSDLRKSSMWARKTLTISGSNWVPLQRSISPQAMTWGRALR